MLPLIIQRLPLSSRTDRYHLWDLCDAHLGSIATDEAALTNLVREIAADPMARWIAGGDKGQFINITDKRFEPEDCASWMQVADLGNLAKRQAARYLEITRPIWSQCLLSIDGNHTDAIYRRYHEDIGAIIAAEMGVPHCRNGAWLRLVFEWATPNNKPRVTAYEIAVLHGWGGGRGAGSAANMMYQALIAFNADIVFLEHRHKRDRLAVNCYAAARNCIVTRQRVAVLSGSFLDGAAYSLTRGYEPAEIGSVRVELHPDRRGIEVRL